MKTDYIGKPVDRVDGPLKVTGKAKYAAEFGADGLTYGYVVSSNIASGKIKSINSMPALELKGVLQVFTHENVPTLAWFDKSYKDDDAVDGSPFRPLHSAKITHSMQPVALVVADTFELARYAASLVEITYDEDAHTTNLEQNLSKSFKAPTQKTGYKPPVSRGNAAEAFAKAPVKIESTYIHSAEHHNPMEIFATTVIVEPDGKLTIYDKTQGVTNCLNYVTKIFWFICKGSARYVAIYGRWFWFRFAAAVPIVPGCFGCAGTETVCARIVDKAADVFFRASAGKCAATGLKC